PAARQSTASGFSASSAAPVSAAWPAASSAVSKTSFFISDLFPQQQFDGVLQALGLKGQIHLRAALGGSVGGVDDLQHGAAVLTGDAGGLVLPHAADEVAQLLGIALVEG